MPAAVIVGGCGNQRGHFKRYIFQVFVDQHPQAAIDSMTDYCRSASGSWLLLKYKPCIMLLILNCNGCHWCLTCHSASFSVTSPISSFLYLKHLDCTLMTLVSCCFALTRGSSHVDLLSSEALFINPTVTICFYHDRTMHMSRQPLYKWLLILQQLNLTNSW